MDENVKLTYFIVFVKKLTLAILQKNICRYCNQKVLMQIEKERKWRNTKTARESAFVNISYVTIPQKKKLFTVE